MSVRKISVTLGAAALAVSGLALSTLAPADADSSATSSVQLGTDMVGVGSDTLQWVTDDLSNYYNTNVAGKTVGSTTYNSAKFLSYSACLGAPATPAGSGANPDGTTFPCSDGSTTPGKKRDESVVDAKGAGHALPAGSGDARTLLMTPSDPLFNDVAFGRSSGPGNSAALAAGEGFLPFALDTISIAVAPNGPAPKSLTGDQVLGIFTGTITNWSQVGGKNAPIHPYIPKSGSSTRNAFMSFMSDVNGTHVDPGDWAPVVNYASATWEGKAVTGADLGAGSTAWKGGTTAVEEHDPTVIENDVDAIEPFSLGRAGIANSKGTVVRIENGWSADRALYYVVRTQPIAGATTTPFLWGSDNNELENLFGPNGWICTSADAKSIVQKDGFYPLSAGQCGVFNKSTVDAAGLVGTGKAPYTTTTATASGRNVKVTVSSASGTPTGTVQLNVYSLSSPNSYSVSGTLSNGTATIALPASVPAGAWTVGASYTPSDATKFTTSSTSAAPIGGSNGSHDITVTLSAAVQKSLKATAKKVGANYVITATVKGITGKVTVKAAGKSYSGAIKKGKATVKVPVAKLHKGKNTAVVSAGGKTVKLTLKR